MKSSRLVAAAWLVGCGSLDEDADAGDAGIDTTVEACGFSPFDCVDATFEAAPPPPPVLCPPSAPIEGTGCAVPAYQECEYGTQDYFCNQHFFCTSNGWQKNTNVTSLFCGTADACDTVVDGGVCHAPSQICPSGDASVCVCSECGAGPPPPPPPDGAPYAVTFWRCFSPNDGCSVARANVGTACDLPDGSTCRYAFSSCCTGVYESCVDGVWLGGGTSPCP